MATYLPNVNRYISKTKDYTPNFKFLSDALARRQDRYDTNYKKMNNLYGSVLHADLSREDNISIRDTYTEQLAPKLQQISGVDFSLQQNVDSAKALFTPFFEDDALVRDLVYTKRYKGESQKMDDYRKSNQEQIRSKYWEGAITMLNYGMADFKNGTRAESMEMRLPEAVEHIDLVERGFAKLKESGMEIQTVEIDASGNYKITQKNGVALTRKRIGTKQNGDPIWTNPAQDFILQTTMDDPSVQRYYQTKFYIEARKFYEANAEKYGSEDAAKKIYAEGVIDKYKKKVEAEAVDKDIEKKNAIHSKNNWEDYQKNKGKLIYGSPEFNDYAQALAEHTAILNGRKMKDKRDVEILTSTEDINELMFNAGNAHMSHFILDDTRKASIKYSEINSERTIEADEFALKNHAHRLKMVEQEMAAYNTRKNTALTKGWERNEQGEWIPTPWADFGGSDNGNGNNEGSNVGVDFYDQESVVAGDGTTTAANYEVDGVVDIVGDNAEASTSKIDEIVAVRFQIVEDYFSDKGPSLSDDDNIVHSTGMEVNGDFMTWEDAKAHYMKPENRSELTAMYENIKDIAKGITSGPKLERSNPDLYKLIMRSESHIKTQQAMLMTGWAKQQDIYTSVLNAEFAKGNITSYEMKLIEGYPVINSRGQVTDPKKIMGTMENDLTNWYNQQVQEGKIKQTREAQNSLGYIKEHDEFAQSMGFKNHSHMYDKLFPNGQAVSMGQQGSDGSIQMLAARHFRNVYDEHFGKNSIDELYTGIKRKMNIAMQTSQGIPGVTNWNMRDHLTGQDQSGGGQTIYNIFKSQYVNGQVNNRANNQIRIIDQLMKGPKGNYSIAMGNRSDSYTSDTDEGAKLVYEQIRRDLGKPTDSFPKGKAPDITISWAEVLGGEDGQGKYGGWVIQLGEGYANGLKSSAHMWNNALVSNIEDNSITIFADKEFHSNNPNSYKNAYVSTTEFLVDQNNTAEIHNDGGRVIFFKNSYGQMSYKHAAAIYNKDANNGTGAIEYTDYSKPQILDPSGYAIDQAWADLEDRSLLNAKTVQEALEAHKLENEKSNK